MEKKLIMVEMGGTTRLIPESSLLKLQNTANDMRELAIKGGFSEEMADKMFTLQIVEDKK